jgi:glycine cleavage system H protein
MARKISQSHEWVDVDGDVATVGISDHAQGQLGDIVFIELPEIGRKVAKGEAVAVVESVKAASDIYAPVSGEIVEVNTAIVSEPAKVNADADHSGWFFKVRLADSRELEGLMNEDEYLKLNP